VAEQNEWVTVRQLPDGEAHSGRLESCAGRQLRVAIPPAKAEFRAGALVEVQSQQILYLGVIQGRQDSVILVAIEHTVDRVALAAIQEVWHGSPGD
jgi:hypothetical protein